MGNTSAPFCRAVYREADHAVVERTAVALCIHYFKFHKYKVCTICLPTFWILNLCQSENGWFACGLYAVTGQFLSILIVTYGKERAFLPYHIVPCIKEMIVLATFAQALAIEEQFY